MLEELQRRNYSQTTVKGYLRVVEAFARYFHRSPDQLGPEQIRAYQVYLFKDRKLNAHTVGQHTAALRFFYCKTLKRQYPIEEVPYPKAPGRLPIILTCPWRIHKSCGDWSLIESSTMSSPPVGFKIDW